MVTWQRVEEQVRAIAEAHWSSPCKSELIAGVQCDGVVRVRADYFVLIEISKRDDLNKQREDIVKLTTMKQALLAKGCYAETYFVTSSDNHPSLSSTADSLGVELHTISTFASKFLGTNEYAYERRKVPFGSAVSPTDGSVDSGPYTAISYTDPSGRQYTIEKIAQLLRAGSRIILLGEFGTGKSRCVMETFEQLASDEDSSFSPVAINLRDNWGYRRLDHMVRNHLDGLGMSQFADNLVKSIRNGNHALLLDGFDEIGSQSWSGDVARLSEVRRKSLEGVRDAVTASGEAGLLITGREHYFSSEGEMRDCLGLPPDTLVLRCPDEFSEPEALAYIHSHAPSLAIPDWMPRKPLICQLLIALDPDELESIQRVSDGEVAFFERVVDAVCRRETRINNAIDASAVKSVLLQLARRSRLQHEHAERLTLSDLNEAFFNVTGYAPIDESAILLQRLPYLGRVGSESSDRNFIDPYAKNGLRGIAMRETFNTGDETAAHEKWLQPLDEFGLRVWAVELVRDKSPLKYVRRCLSLGNAQAAADYVAARLMLDSSKVDFENLTIDGASISCLRFVDVDVSGLSLVNVDIDRLEIDNASFENVSLNSCLVERVSGVSSPDKMPFPMGTASHVQEFDTVLSSAKISTLNLSDGQKTLLVIIKKLFFQPGSGRREEALIRGTEAYWNRNTAEEVLRYMDSHDIVLKAKGDQGLIYVPQRREMRRMAQITHEQKRSIDPLWELVS